MLNTTPLNTSELNSPGASAETVLLAASGAVAVVGTPSTLVFAVGMDAGGVAAVTQSAAATRGRTVGSVAAASVAGSAEPTQAKSLASVGAVGVTGVIGLSIPHSLAASASVVAAGAIYSGAELYSTSAVAVTSSAAASNIEALFATGAVAATDAESGHIVNGLYAAGAVAAVGIADPDAEVGGVLQVGLGGRPVVAVTSEVEIDPAEAVAASGPVAITSSAALTIRFKLPAPGSVAVVGGTPELQVYTGGLSGAMLVTVAGAAAATRYASLGSASAVSVSALSRAGSVLSLGAAATVAVTETTTPILWRGLRSTSPVAVAGSASAPRIAEKIYGTGAIAVTSFASPIYYVRKNVGANALVSVAHFAAPVYFTRRRLEATATISVDGELQPRSLSGLATVSPVVATGAATLRTNQFSLEPDYRTLAVLADIDTLGVEPQEFTLIVTTDSVPMITFTKQPTEILPYDIDFELWLAGITGGDEIESATCSVVSASSGSTAALTIDSVLLIADTARVKVWVSGGTNGVTYKLTLIMLTSAGRRKEVDFRVKIKET